MNREQILAVAKPILFNTEMVQALLDDRKHVTRRVVKPPYYIDDEEICRTSGLAMHQGIRATDGMPYPDAPYHPGDLLYVQETWGIVNSFPYEQGYDVAFKASSQILYCTFTPERYAKFAKFRGKRGWQSPYFMPKEAARIFLWVTDVRVERLRDITEEQAKAEGFASRKDFMEAFLKMYPECTEDSWLWVIEFEREKIS